MPGRAGRGEGWYDPGRMGGSANGSVDLSPLHERLLAAAGNRSYRQLADLTRTSKESARRYMTGTPPPADFLVGFCAALGINGDWLLTGRGPMYAREVERHVLTEAGPTDLMAAMAARVESILNRLERLEIFFQTTETRLLAEIVRAEERIGRLHDGRAPAQDPAEARAAAPGQSGADAQARAGRIADAIARRPPADAPATARTGGA